MRGERGKPPEWLDVHARNLTLAAGQVGKTGLGVGRRQAPELALKRAGASRLVEYHYTTGQYRGFRGATAPNKHTTNTAGIRFVLLASAEIHAGIRDEQRMAQTRESAHDTRTS